MRCLSGHRPFKPLKSRCEVDESTGCWVWQGTRLAGGYGSVSVRGRTVLAHRLSFELSVGQIPTGMFVCHKCDNPACVNPAHLFLGTPADNVRDAVAKGRMAHGSAHLRSKLTEEQVADILRRCAAGERQMDLAAEYGVGRAAVNRIVLGYTWRHVSRENLMGGADGPKKAKIAATWNMGV